MRKGSIITNRHGIQLVISLALALALTLTLSIVPSVAAAKDERRTSPQAYAPAAETSASNPISQARDAARRILGNRFNPSIGIILNGKYAWFSADESEFARFAVGHEGERGLKGISIDESELNFSANVDDKFLGSLTAAIVREEGEQIVELEEAYVQTLPQLGLLRGLTVKAGRAFWTFGYMNEHHAHTDDFADRPLPYRAFLNRAFNDDGIEVSWVLPIDLYAEAGAGMFRGEDFPFGGSDASGIEAWSVFARVGGDIGANLNWRAGGYVLSGKAKAGRVSNEDALTFSGDTALYAGDVRMSWAPTGNRRQQEVTLQAEYFWREEDGTYNEVAFDDSSSGWYVQGVYQFAQQWRAGVRASQLIGVDEPERSPLLRDSPLGAPGHNPIAYAVMLDWTNSEFSRLRLQYAHEELSQGNTDNQVVLQYVMSIGAHGAHRY